jgi:hypothetical protein
LQGETSSAPSDIANSVLSAAGLVTSSTPISPRGLMVV